ncbi:MAG: acyltransferase family protein [Clostridium sp.]|uniref:acyltransferase family protein n=1 Tax=Clostridium sp. TaxID=1506 RepID=UPI003035F5C6
MSYLTDDFKNNTYIERDDKGRIIFWDNLKFLLILLVVVGHAIDFYTESSLSMRKVYVFIYSFHMPLFIFISGYFSKSVINKERFKIEKVFSYLLLYFLLKLSFFILYRYGFGSANVKFNFFSEGGVPWYLFVMAMWLCVTYIIKNIKPVYVIVAAILLGILIGYDDSVSDFMCLSRVVVFYPYFILGYYFNEDNIIKILKCNKLKWVSLAITLITIVVIMKFGDDVYRFRWFFSGRNSYVKLNEPIYGGIYRMAIYVLSTLISLALIYIIPKGKLFVTKFGTRTLQVYFLHYILLNIYHKYNLNSYIMNEFPKYWKILYIFLAIILTLILSLKVFEYPFNKVMSIKLEKIFRGYDLGEEEKLPLKINQ